MVDRAESGTNKFLDNGINTILECGKNISLSGSVTGKNNRIIIEGAVKPSHFEIFLNTDNCLVEIEKASRIDNLKLVSGRHFKTSNIRLKIGKNAVFNGNTTVLLTNPGNVCEIGSNCLFSNSIFIRCGELPHLIFDMETGEYVGHSEGVFISDNVWVGANVLMTKRAAVAEGSIIGVRSVVTRKFKEKNVVIAGNPAKIMRRNVKWFKNLTCLPKGGKYKLPDFYFES